MLEIVILPQFVGLFMREMMVYHNKMMKQTELKIQGNKQTYSCKREKPESNPTIVDFSLALYVYIYIYMYIYISIYIYIHKHRYQHKYIYIYTIRCIMYTNTHLSIYL